MSELQMKQSLAKEEQASAAAPGYVARHEVSALGMILQGLELEDMQ